MKVREKPRGPEDWIACDLDKTLAKYVSGDYDRYGEFFIGPPILPMIKTIKKHIENGWTVKVFTARASHSTNIERLKRTVGDWTAIHIGTRLEVTNVKDRYMEALYDDRAIGMRPNTGYSDVQEALADFTLEMHRTVSKAAADCFDRLFPGDKG